MVSTQYVPERGDLVWLDFDPQLGHEQSGRRPAITISPKSYNEITNLGLFCPITSQIKNYPFEVVLNNTKLISGVILTDQIKSLDWKFRHAVLIEKASINVINEVQHKISLLLEK